MPKIKFKYIGGMERLSGKPMKLYNLEAPGHVLNHSTLEVTKMKELLRETGQLKKLGFVKKKQKPKSLEQIFAPPPSSTIDDSYNINDTVPKTTMVG